MFGHKAARVMLLMMAALGLGGCLGLSELRDLNEQQKQKIADLEKSHEEYSHAYYDLKTQTEVSQTSLTKRIDGLTLQIARLNRLHSEQMAEQERQKREITACLTADLDKRASETLDLRHKILDMETAQKELQAKYEKTEKARAALEKHLEESQRDLIEARGKIAELTSSTKKLAKDLETSKGETKDALAKLADKEKENAALKKDIEKNTKEIEGLKAKAAELETTRKELAELKDSVNRSVIQRKESEKDVGQRIQDLATKMKAQESASEKARVAEEWLAQSGEAIKTPREGMPADPKLEKLYGAALADLKKEIDQGEVKVERDRRGVVIIVPADNMFDNLTIVRESAVKILKAISQLAGKFSGADLLIEGHTDNERISKSLYYDNLELSMVRAVNVYRKMVEEVTPKLDAGRARAVGCGEFYPIAKNSTAEGKRQNRRIEFVFTALY